MKQLFLSVLVTLISVACFAQSPLALTEKQVNAGFGLYGKGTSFMVGMDFGIMENITAGGELALRSKTNAFLGGKIKYNGFGLGANMNYHFGNLFNLDSKIDVYGGLNLNYFRWNTDIVDTSGNPTNYIGKLDYSSGLGIDLQIGGRYFFTDKFGVNLELGGMSYSGGKVGITYKF
ncbi:MAG: hypothetical protein EOO99_05060 [Pedobacter sp.]|nr:MAG: hypothetical protein EOO99_05060 [Pedobacter sp.]